LLQAMRAMHLSDRIDALWRTSSHDELLRFHAWLSVMLPLRMLHLQSGRNIVAGWEPVFTPFPGKCTARLSLRKHWTDALRLAPRPTLRGAALWDLMVAEHGRRRKPSDPEAAASPRWPRNLLTTLVGQVTLSKRGGARKKSP
jgi:hypothetical protein